MNKKGFTLVELLAVIAILAILVIMALPAVLRMFNNARRDSFTNEVNTVIRTARQQYLLSGGSDTKWSNAEGSTSTLDLTGNSHLKYYVQMNNEGKITKLQVTNGDFQYSKTGIIDIVESNDVQTISELAENDILTLDSFVFVPDPVSFATDSWETIQNAVRNNNISAYGIGDTKTIDLGSLGTHTVKIVNNSTPNECSDESFSQTSCGFVIEFSDIIENRQMNPTKSSAGGWPNTSLRAYLNENFYQQLPTDLRNAIVDTRVISGSESSSINNYVTTDKLYLLSYKEVFNNNSAANDYLTQTRQLDYYANNNASTSNPYPAVKKYNNANKAWWLRSANRAFYNYYFTVIYDGGSTYYTAKEANEQLGVSPAFRIG